MGVSKCRRSYFKSGNYVVSSQFWSVGQIGMVTFRFDVLMLLLVRMVRAVLLLAE